jgi:hypothetical protein
MAAAILEVAALAGACVVERPEPVGRLGRGRCYHPVALEEAVADEEIGALLERQVGSRQREGIGAVGLLMRRGAARMPLERLRLGEVAGRLQDRRHIGACQRQRKQRQSADDTDADAPPV